MAEWDAVVKKLEEMVARIERLSVEQKVVGPKRDKEVDDLLKEARAVVSDFRQKQQRQKEDERYGKALEAIGKSITAAMDRLTASEARLEQVEDALTGRDGGVFDVDPELLEEGEFLRAQLAGPPTPGVETRYLKDAPRPDYVSGLSVLGAAIRQAPTPKTTSQTA